MSVTSDFDRFFLNLPPFDKETDFNSFWRGSIKKLKKIPIDPIFEESDKNSSKKFEILNATFRGYEKSPVRGEIYLPIDVKKPKVIVYIPDYNQPYKPIQDLPDSDIAFFFLKLRGHRSVYSNENKDNRKSPGYMSENILDKDSYYVKSIYLDAYRSLEMLRLFDKLDCSTVGLMGKGLGASAALFTASYSPRVAAVVLDTPSFCYLELSQNISSSDATNEINAFISEHKGKKNMIKKNLTYFDAINFSDNIKCPILVTVGLKDILSPPECVFALFNHLLCDKLVEVYPEDGYKAGGEKQIQKSLNWLKGIIMDS